MSDQRTVTVLLFAGARDVVGSQSIQLELDAPAMTVAAFADVLYSRYPALQPYARALRIAVNGTYARSDESIRPGDEVAIIPPVAGG